MPLPESFQNFDIENSSVQIWLFKKWSQPDGLLRFSGRWIDTDDDLDQALKQAIAFKRQSILEVSDYTLLAAANDGIALRIDALATHAGVVAAEAANPLPARKIRSLDDVQNTKFYVIKLTSGDNVLYAVRKTDATWQSRRVSGFLSVIYSDDRLGLNENPGFNISRDIDFFIIEDDVVITNKPAFESVLSYKEAHVADFNLLQADDEFSSLFSDLGPLIDFIGVNKLHLRRACAIHQKGHYRDAAFMTRLRQRHAQCGLQLVFDDQGRIVATLESCSDIMRALLDHRLSSLFSENNYDVPDATVVA
ncbi:Kiwa anti-phage protein KwaB-like domain-containing protein [Kaistia terrae]|uniref:Kiwa anti-phage protein KwaB-like domain-containing protein n=1 Tax=Kaistia terrae TaxID=537017 RepID=A0ABW0PTA0_9HYPH|nr:Kiwa anti-phage protein KwaB-like domain-containing protein [Kaistia terrae]MCX5577304.1 DUF4868 domain-containing protein [Kaistia terrae]